MPPWTPLWLDDVGPTGLCQSSDLIQLQLPGSEIPPEKLQLGLDKFLPLWRMGTQWFREKAMSSHLVCEAQANLARTSW